VAAAAAALPGASPLPGRNPIVMIKTAGVEFNIYSEAYSPKC
jgi:hypothetical protein